ncbi:MAG TPA: cyclic nucleotide-binding domain-containing protein, partial [Promineifilum sp.]
MQSTDDRGIDPQLLDLLRGIADIQTYAPGTELTRQGESEHTFYVIESGSAIVLRKLEGGEDQLLNTLGPRQPFGELA